MAATPPADDALRATLDACRADGAERRDPMRWRVIEALARRMPGASAQARPWLQARLAQLLADCDAQLRQAPVPATPALTHRSPLAELLAHIAQHADGSEDPVATTSHAHAHANPVPELKSLRRFRRTWTRLSAEQRLTQSEARLPDNAGPLHSQRLLHRALTAMQAHSPEYLEHFVAHVDALLWLDQVHGGDLWSQKDVLVPDGQRKRSKPRRRPSP